MNKALKTLSDEMAEKLIKQDQPHEIAPMLATLTHDYFSDPNWLYEPKLDGERCLLYKQGKRIMMLSRNQKEQDDYYPEINQALKKMPGNFILDCELVVFDGKITSFSKLQNRMHVKNPSDKLIKKFPVLAYAFDILYLDGFSLECLPLRKRKSILKNAFSFASPIHYLPHRNEKGKKYLNEVCSKGMEGLIAKDAESQYVHHRSKKWLKFKCGHGQEFVIGGYTKPQGQRIGFGALLLGYYKDTQLIYCGRVGTGFDDEFLEFLHHRMQQIQTENSAFDDYAEEDDEVNWIKPELVAEVGFSEWTEHGKLRHPRFLGLRKDKDPKDVHREEGDDE